jgi:hypothetical protein
LVGRVATEFALQASVFTEAEANLNYDDSRRARSSYDGGRS